MFTHREKKVERGRRKEEGYGNRIREISEHQKEGRERGREGGREGGRERREGGDIERSRSREERADSNDTIPWEGVCTPTIQTLCGPSYELKTDQSTLACTAHTHTHTKPSLSPKTATNTNSIC